MCCVHARALHIRYANVVLFIRANEPVSSAAQPRRVLERIHKRPAFSFTTPLLLSERVRDASDYSVRETRNAVRIRNRVLAIAIIDVIDRMVGKKSNASSLSLFFPYADVTRELCRDDDDDDGTSTHGSRFASSAIASRPPRSGIRLMTIHE